MTLVDDVVLDSADALLAELDDGHGGARRRASALDRLSDTLTELDTTLVIPAPVTEVRRRGRGAGPSLTAAAFEMARRVYYLEHGSVYDAARAIVAAGLAGDASQSVIAGRLRLWWEREGWPVRSHAATVALRDAANNGALYRSTRTCEGQRTTGKHAAIDEPCGQSALEDSDFCWQHDPRPEYVARRLEHGKRLADARAADMVDMAPFRAWCDSERSRLLAGAPAARGSGTRLMADWLGVSYQSLCRLLKPPPSANGGRARTQIRAKTVERYLRNIDVTFVDVYGHEPPKPPVAADRREICPLCDGPKHIASKTCNPCSRTDRVRCSRVRAGGRCTRRTAHPSGICAECRKTTSRVAAAPFRSLDALTPSMLVLALDGYVADPAFTRVAERMWSLNAAGVRETFTTARNLTRTLLKYFGERGWDAPQVATRALDELAAAHGPAVWPTTPVPDVGSTTSTLAFEPFGAWLAERKHELGSYRALSARVGIGKDTLSRWLTGRTPKSTIRRADVQRALARWEGGTSLEDLYSAAPAGDDADAR